jgi:hypothetical protein
MTQTPHADYRNLKMQLLADDKAAREKREREYLDSFKTDPKPAATPDKQESPDG